MDIPEANCVIRFDSMVHTVSLVQGRGRARAAQSSMVVLSERSDRSVAKLMETEELQRRIVSDIRPDANHSALQTKPKDKHGEARSLLEKDPSFAVLNEYCQKMKASLETHFEIAADGSGWQCKLVYISNDRQFSSEYIGRGKQDAKASAAVQLLQALKNDQGVLA